MLNFSTVKLAPSPHPPLPVAIPYSFGKKICTQPIVKDRWLCSSSFRVEYLFKLFEILVHGRYFFSTVTCIQPFICISMIHGYLFYTLGWPWSKKWSGAKANRVLAREHTGHSKHPLPTTQDKIYTWTSPDGQHQNQIDNIGASLVAQRLKCLPPMQETQVLSLSREDPLEKETAPHSGVLAWRIPWMEKPGRLQSTSSQRVEHDWATSLYSTILFRQRWRSSIQSAKTRPGADCGSDHELLIDKFRLKLKKVGKTTRPFTYDLNQIPYDYTVEVRNVRF